MKRLIFATLLLAISACETPPPIRHGKCVVDYYQGEKAMKQNCNYQGYAWFCTKNGDGYECLRTGDAVGERTPASAPQ